MFRIKNMSKDIRWYYLIEMGLYVYLLASQRFDTKRKDFWVEFVHHIITLGLLSFSFCMHGHRAGSVVLLLHDSADGFLLVSGISWVA